VTNPPVTKFFGMTADQFARLLTVINYIHYGLLGLAVVGAVASFFIPAAEDLRFPCFLAVMVLIGLIFNTSILRGLMSRR
jgi:hypothetical protein